MRQEVQQRLKRKSKKESILNPIAVSNFIQSKWHALVNQGLFLRPLITSSSLRKSKQSSLSQPQQQQQPKSSNKKKFSPPLGLFRQLCVSAVAGELFFHFNALQNGEEDYPLIVMIDKQNHLIQFPGLHQISTYINN